jgi:aminoglycoside 6'-N-acetyltransferase I
LAVYYLLGPLIERCQSVEQPGWLTLRKALWPDSSDDELLAEMSLFLANPDRFVQFVAYGPTREPIGFAEASMRYDCVNGTGSSPVLFLEGLYVRPASRRAGLARELVSTVAAWGMQRGCTEFASDTPLHNELSQAVHAALGFRETERVVYFCKELP